MMQLVFENLQEVFEFVDNYRNEQYDVSAISIPPEAENCKTEYMIHVRKQLENNKNEI